MTMRHAALALALALLALTPGCLEPVAYAMHAARVHGAERTLLEGVQDLTRILRSSRNGTAGTALVLAVANATAANASRVRDTLSGVWPADWQSTVTALQTGSDRLAVLARDGAACARQGDLRSGGPCGGLVPGLAEVVTRVAAAEAARPSP